jgi:hypothetical protein
VHYPRSTGEFQSWFATDADRLLRRGGEMPFDGGWITGEGAASVAEAGS